MNMNMNITKGFQIHKILYPKINFDYAVLQTKGFLDVIYTESMNLHKLLLGHNDNIYPRSSQP